ncbi:class F sortase [Microlunatus antarcticus]|uniref:LPXTG-site transpeptidase (Sortase) family protein n=1 Tax=Microlunatus antarcticus TaxID=53388 RepID=A0A7W5JX83_9ACTN|nr:class F sortase [Microlunatus antarcticus]MBB3327989.1 LPXTG-site transpeptidase (sortase) family protein [Microlunatus antarcticus]
MTVRPPRQDGWLWPAVLAASALLVLLAGQQVVATPTVAAGVPVSTQLEPVAPATLPALEPAPTPSASARDVPERAWKTRPATPRKPVDRTAPDRVVAKAVGLDLRVVPTGVAKNGQMALPEKPTELGWYRFGAAPGDRRGAVVVAGHVDSDRYGAGPLTRVAGLERGDRVELHDGYDGTTTYEVTKVQRIDKDDFTPDAVFDRSGPAVLRLITCGGAYDAENGGYQDNLVVTAVPR